MKIIVVVRKPGTFTRDHDLTFNVPAVPEVGSYISMLLSKESSASEDVIVRHIWWHLRAPESDDSSDSTNEEVSSGDVDTIMVECDVALGPYASNSWRQWAVAAEERGVKVERFETSRFVFKPPREGT
jgi:hypothetical protein